MSEEIEVEEEVRETRRKRSAQPRLGSFVTIAVAILLLFGAASRMGKMPEAGGLFNIDFFADRQAQYEQNRIRQDEERLRTFLTIGAVPVQQPASDAGQVAMALDQNPETPYRGEFDIDEQRRRNRAVVSMPLPDTRGDGEDARPPSGEAVPRTTTHNPAPEAVSSPRGGAEGYVVATGDTWVKIAKNTLGDSKRWQDIQKANPEAQNGLRVGMRLVIPQ